MYGQRRCIVEAKKKRERNGDRENKCRRRSTEMVNRWADGCWPLNFAHRTSVVSEFSFIASTSLTLSPPVTLSGITALNFLLSYALYMYFVYVTFDVGKYRRHTHRTPVAPAMRYGTKKSWKPKSHWNENLRTSIRWRIVCTKHRRWTPVTAPAPATQQIPKMNHGQRERIHAWHWCLFAGKCKQAYENWWKLINQ